MSKQSEQCGVKLIIDVDMGVDDAQALMMALCSTSGAQVVAITCVDGNTVVEQVCRNTVRGASAALCRCVIDRNAAGGCAAGERVHVL